MEIKLASLTIMTTLLVILILSLVIVFIVLGDRYYNKRIYDVLIKNKSIISIFLIISIFFVPILKLDGLTLNRESLLIYARELFYSIFFVASFILSWKLFDIKTIHRKIMKNKDNTRVFGGHDKYPSVDSDNTTCYVPNDGESKELLKYKRGDEKAEVYSIVE